MKTMQNLLLIAIALAILGGCSTKRSLVVYSNTTWTADINDYPGNLPDLPDGYRRMYGWNTREITLNDDPPYHAIIRMTTDTGSVYAIFRERSRSITGSESVIVDTLRIETPRGYGEMFWRND